MQTQQIIRGAAEVLTITRLAVNDTYKRVEESAYSGGPTLRYGVVTDVMDNGADAAVVAVEFRPADFGSGVQIERKVITGSAPLAIYPATPEEVREHMDGVLDAARRAQDTAREAWEKACVMTVRVEAVQESLNMGALTAPETTTGPLPVEASPEGQGPDEPGF